MKKKTNTRKIAVRTINDYIYYLSNKKQVFVSNLLAGLSRGVGMAIGFWILSALIVYFLSLLAASGLPFLEKIVKLIMDEAEKYT